MFLELAVAESQEISVIGWRGDDCGDGDDCCVGEGEEKG